MSPPLELPVKPLKASNCTGCGYCCTAAPCQLAQDFLNCHVGPCVALELHEGLTRCGLVRNPLGYLYRAARPEAPAALLAEEPNSEAGHQLSVQLATALGLGMGCDAEDDEESQAWSDMTGAQRAKAATRD